MIIIIIIVAIFKIKIIDLVIGYGLPDTGNGAAGFTLK